jgi:hypothetical protein
MGIHTKHETRIELNFFEYSDSKKYYSEPEVVEYNRVVGGSMTSFLAQRP